MIQDAGIVSTGAGTHSPHPLQVTAKVAKSGWRFPELEPSIGEHTANLPAGLYGTWQEDSTIRFGTSVSLSSGKLGFPERRWTEEELSRLFT